MPHHVRIYLPLTPAQCRDLANTRRVEGPLAGYAVTESLRASDPDGDAESWEYAALQDAAAAAYEDRRPVVVAAVDLDRDQFDDTASTGSRIEVTGVVTLPRVAALHVGDDVLGGPAPPEAGAEIELSWFDTTEFGYLTSLL